MVTFADSPQAQVTDSENATLSDHFVAEVFLAQDTGTMNADGKDIVNIFGGGKYGWQVQAG